MSLWYNGRLNARALPDGTFISTDIQQKRLDLLRNNTQYRENIETAMKMSGYTDKLLVASRGGVAGMDKILDQTAKAERVTKEKTDESIERSNIIVSN